MAILSIQNLTKSYTDKPVLNNLSLDIEEHTFNSILGRSGSGKTTLLNIMSTLDTFDQGSLFVEGHDVKRLDEKTLNQLRNQMFGFVFQDFNLMDELTILDNVAIPLLLNGYSIKEARRRAAIALKKVELNQFIKLKPYELSGGQKQRVAIARAIVNDQKIILCDEPTGAIDEKIAIEILSILKELTKEKTIIMVTHDEAYAKRYSDRIIILSDGKILQDSNFFQDDTSNKKDISIKNRDIQKKSLLYLSLNSFELSHRYLNRTLRLISMSAIVFLLINYMSHQFLNIFNSVLSGQPFTAPIFKIISMLYVKIVIYVMLFLSFMSFLFIFNSFVQEKKKDVAVLKAFGASQGVIRALFILKTIQLSILLLRKLVIGLLITLIIINIYPYTRYLFNAQLDTFVLHLFEKLKGIGQSFVQKGDFKVTGVYYLQFVFMYVFMITVIILEVIASSFIVSKEDTIKVLARE